MWFKETKNSENNEENTQQTHSANAAATNTAEISSNDTTTPDQLQSVAARSVLEMGYTKEQVLDALRKINELRPGMSFSFFHHISVSSRNIQDTYKLSIQQMCILNEIEANNIEKLMTTYSINHKINLNQR